MQQSQDRTPCVAQAPTPKNGAAAKKPVNLSDQEKATYGINRCPAGYKKINLLGKGGIALVWLGVSAADGS